jgi:hypothetical protein
MTAEVTALIARPHLVPQDCPDAILLQAVREFMLGAEYQAVATMLGVQVVNVHRIVRSPEWRHLQNQFRDEFIASTTPRTVRIENMLLDKIEEYVENGITCWFTDKEGQPQSYSREITPKEAVSIALMFNETNKRLDRLREGDTSRKKFDSAKLIGELEGVARRIPDEPEAKSA